MIPLTPAEGGHESVAPRIQLDGRGIYEPLGINGGELRSKLPHSRIRTRILNIIPELNAGGLIKCSLRTCCIFVETLYGDWLANEAEANKSDDSTVSRRSASEEAKTNGQTMLEDYVALSYVWGPDGNHKTIEVNGKLFRVRPNLWQFLNHARTSLPWLSNIWIDALCINQGDVDERNYQVKCMGVIYAEASQVLVWLGKNLEEYDQMLDIANEYSDRAPHPLNVESHTDVIHDACQRRAITPQEFSATLDKFLNLEYWLRAWVVEEFFLAKRLVIMSASRTITYEVLARALDVATDHRNDSLVEDSVRQSSLNTYIIFIYEREAFLQKNNNKMSRARLYRGRGDVQFGNVHSFKCSDPRDRIYSQLSLVFKGWEFHVDYREDTYTLFLRTVLFCFGNQDVQEGLFFQWWNFIQGLELGPESILNLLFARARESEQHQNLLTEFKQQTVLYSAVIHDWDISDNSDMKCPDCSLLVTPGNGATAFDRFCCLRLKQKPGFFWQCHISFPSATKAHIDDHWLLAHFEHSKHLLRQRARVAAATGVRLNLLTCLQLWEGHISDAICTDHSQPK